MSLETQSFAFGEFILDPEEKVLFRDNKPVSITPKAFELLLILLQNHGHLVDKDRLIASIWSDSFVEDGNLAVTINQLRKALDDNAHAPIFIENVPRRGYRFIAELRRVERNVQVAKTEGTVPMVPSFDKASRLISKQVLAAATILVILLAAGFALILRNRNANGAGFAAPEFSVERLSTTGKVHYAVISRDGKNVFYTNISGGKQSVWLRQLDSSNNVQIIPPSDDTYFGLDTSPDGRFLYFSRLPQHEERQGDIYRVSIFGGIPTMIVSRAQGWMSISSDGNRISYVRCEYRVDENCSLWIADAADGANEKKIAARPKPFRIADNAISPDGRSVAFAVGQSENSANEFGLSQVDIESGKERPITDEKFFNIKTMAWLNSGNGLIVSASQVPSRTYRLWEVSSGSGEVRPLSKDAENYDQLSIDDEMSKLAAVTIRSDFQAVLYPMNSSAGQQVVADASKLEFAASGQLLFSSGMSGNQEIWSVNTDGSGERQLTNDPADDLDPLFVPEVNTIFFASNRSGSLQVWRMNVDGSNQTQVTHQDGGFPVFLTRDGKWLYFHHGLTRALWRISLSDGSEELVIGDGKYRWAISPDGTRVAFHSHRGAGVSIDVVSLDDKRLLQSFAVADNGSKVGEISWLADSSGIAFVLSDNELLRNKLWIQPLNGGKPKQIADLGDELIEHLKISRDQRSFAVVKGDWRHDAVLLRMGTPRNL